MSENHPTGSSQPDPLTAEYPPADYSAGQSEPQDTADVAKDQAANVGASAADAGQHVAGVAKDQAENVVAEAADQARTLLDQAQSELTSQAGTQQQRLAQGLHSLADQLQSMAQGAEPGMVTDLTRQGSTKSQEVASWLESREPRHVLDEAQSFARRRPGVFLVAAAGAGLLAGRLTRGLKDADGDDANTDVDTGATATSTFDAPGYVEPAYVEPQRARPIGYDVSPVTGDEPEPYVGGSQTREGFSSSGGGL